MIFRDPKEITVKDGDGKEKTFSLSKMTAWDGLEIMSRFPGSILATAVPKISDWEIVQKLQLKIMKYVSVDVNGTLLSLSTQELIDNHCTDWEVLGRLLVAEVEYNNSFFRNGTASSFFGAIARQYLAKISEILIQSLEQSYPQGKPPSTN